MTTYTTNKNLALPAYNQTSPTWDVPLNSDFTIIDDAFGGTTTVSLTNVNVTLTQTQTQKACIKLTGTLTGNVTINFPASVSGYYLVNNATTGSFTVTLAYTGGAGPTFATKQGVFNFVWVDASAGGVYAASNAQIIAGSGISVTGSTVSVNWPLSTTYGGTGASVYTDGQLLIGNSNSGSLTPATITAGSNITITNGNGTITIAGAALSINPAASYTFTGLQTFNGSSANLAAFFTNISQSSSPDSSTTVTGTINYDVTSSGDILYRSGNATGNWTINFRGNSTTTLASIMSTWTTIIVSYTVTCGATPYAATALTIDSASVTPYWEGGSAPSGYANAKNVYTYKIIKTNVGWDVYASLSKFA